MIFTFAGKKHKYIRSKKLVDSYGYHLESVNGKHGIVAVRQKLKGKMELNTNIHEMLHACAGYANEEWVNSTASEIAEALWKLGYRKIDETNKKEGK